MCRKYQLLREAAYEQGTAEFELLASEASFRDFVCLYIAEGYKRNRNRVSVANSDASVVVLCTRWIRAFARNPVTFSVQYTRIRISARSRSSGAAMSMSHPKQFGCSASRTAVNWAGTAGDPGMGYSRLRRATPSCAHASKDGSIVCRSSG
jgi:hypothetical protein